MIVETYKYTNQWDKSFNTDLDSKNTLILIFSSKPCHELQSQVDEITEIFPDSLITGASTAGEIYQDEVFDDCITVSIVKFERTKILSISKEVELKDSFQDGSEMAQQLLADDLKSVFVLSDGLKVNGSQLTAGINESLPKGIVATGGLAADKDKFEKTCILVDGQLRDGFVNMIGFYGESIQVAYGSKGGWDKLGLERQVTHSKDNIVYELDGIPALTLYKKYLGDRASGLPATGLLFPLLVQEDKNIDESHVRTIIGINEENNSIIFAGDIPEGSYATLMKANKDRLIDGSIGASRMLNLKKHLDEPILNIAISCVGRKLVLKQRTEEELEGCLEVLPKHTKQIGFYSYGEISLDTSGKCDFLNQTMTLTTLWESHA